MKANPLKRGYSRATIEANIAREVKRGRPAKVAEAMAYRIAREAFRERHKGRRYPAYLERHHAPIAAKAAKRKTSTKKNPGHGPATRITLFTDPAITRKNPRVTKRGTDKKRHSPKKKGYNLYEGRKKIGHVATLKAAAKVGQAIANRHRKRIEVRPA